MAARNKIDEHVIKRQIFVDVASHQESCRFSPSDFPNQAAFDIAGASFLDQVFQACASNENLQRDVFNSST